MLLDVPSSMNYPAWVNRAIKAQMKHCFSYDFFLGKDKPLIFINNRNWVPFWGRYTRKNHVIELRVNILEMPVGYLTHTITHELCHILEYNHGERFQALCSMMFPQYNLYNPNDALKQHKK